MCIEHCIFTLQVNELRGQIDYYGTKDTSGHSATSHVSVEEEFLGSGATRTARSGAEDRHKEQLKRMDKERKEANEVSKEANEVSKEANEVSKEANEVSKEANEVSKEANEVSKEANEVSRSGGKQVKRSGGKGGYYVRRS